MLKFILATVLLAVLSPAVIFGGASKQFTPEQAELLARAAAEAKGVTKLSGFSLERARMEQFPNFYFFDALVSERGAEGFSGHYAVHKLTGDVWDPYACSRLSSPRLLALQRKLRKEMGLTTKEYELHQKDDPCLAGG